MHQEAVEEVAVAAACLGFRIVIRDAPRVGAMVWVSGVIVRRMVALVTLEFNERTGIRIPFSNHIF
jgi:hypothetical protein